MAERTITDLRQKQALPLDAKILLTKRRIKEWVNEFGEDGVYISFSGGKDSTVLLDIVRNVCGYKDISAVFCDVPTQYPELRDFAKTFDNVVIVKPKISFMQICEKYGFPLISKEVAGVIHEARKHLTVENCKLSKTQGSDILKIEGEPHWAVARVYGIVTKDGEIKINPSKEEKSPYTYEKYKFMLDAPFDVANNCCGVMKKEPLHSYQKQTGRLPFVATMAEESMLRTSTWIKKGCNAFEQKNPKSSPMSFWTEQDVLQYIYERQLPICSVYGDVIQVNNQLSLVDVGIDMGDFRPCYETTGCNRTGCMLCGFGAHLEIESRFQRLHKTHPKMYALLDKFKNNGYTMREAIEWVNEHGNLNIRL